MTIANKHQHLAAVKTALAEKYMRLAASVKSKPRRQSYLRQAQRYRQQAEQMLRPLARVT